MRDRIDWFAVQTFRESSGTLASFLRGIDIAGHPICECMISASSNVRVKRYAERAVSGAKYRLYCRQMLFVLNRWAETGYNFVLIKSDHIEFIGVARMREPWLARWHDGSSFHRRRRGQLHRSSAGRNFRIFC